jgi:cytoskeleton protein RodZ
MSEQSHRDRVVELREVQLRRTAGGRVTPVGDGTAVPEQDPNGPAALSPEVSAESMTSNAPIPDQDQNRGVQPSAAAGQQPVADDVSRRPDERPVTMPAVGAVFRKRRAEYGLTLDDVEADLCIRKAYLEAIEAGDFESLPGMTYAVGFVRAYSNLVDLDSTEMVRLFKNESQGTEIAEPEPPRSRLHRLKPGGPSSRTATAGAAQSRIDVPTHRPPRKVTASIAIAEPIHHVSAGRIAGIVTVLIVLGAVGWAFLGPEPSDESNVASTPVAGAGAGDQAATIGDTGSGQQDLATGRASLAGETGPNVQGGPAGHARTPIAVGTLNIALPPPSSRPVGTSNPMAPAMSPSPIVGSGTVTVESAAVIETRRAAGVPFANIDRLIAVGNVAGPPAFARAAQPVSIRPQAAAATPQPATAGGPAVVIDTSVLESGGSSVAAPAVATAPVLPPPPTTTPPQAAGGHNVLGAVNGQSRVAITATSPTAIRIHSTSGQVLFDGILRPGDEFRVPNQNGLLLATSSAGALKISVDGNAAPAIGPKGARRENVFLNPMLLLAGRAAPR